jgi:hypothetical protein
MARAQFPDNGDLLRCGAGCLGNFESVAGALQCIQLALPRFVKLSNWLAREFDVSLGRDGRRIIFSQIRPGDELRARRRADVRTGDLALRTDEVTHCQSSSRIPFGEACWRCGACTFGPFPPSFGLTRRLGLMTMRCASASFGLRPRRSRKPSGRQPSLGGPAVRAALKHYYRVDSDKSRKPNERHRAALTFSEGLILELRTCQNPGSARGLPNPALASLRFALELEGFMEQEKAAGQGKRLAR